MEAYLQSVRPFLNLLFRLHDFASSLLVRHFIFLKKAILVVASLSLFGALYPVVFRQYGELAGNLLIVILFLSPLSKILRMRVLLQLMGFRRELGILMGYLALVHGLGFMIQFGGLTLFSLPPNPELIDFFAVFGGVGLLLVLPLLFTSNTVSVKFFGPYWKRIHFLVYPAFLVIVLHRMLAGIEGGSPGKMIEAGLLLGSYILLKAFSWKPFFPWASRFFLVIADEYRQFVIRSKEQ